MLTECVQNEMVKTARSKGAVGKNAILPRYISEFGAWKSKLILDFGCGKDAIHIKALREKGFEFVFGVDLVPLSEPVYEVKQDLPWHLVYASNVLNVQPSLVALKTTVNQIADYARHGVAYLSYPGSPRKLGFPTFKMQERLTPYFKEVYRFSYRNTTIFKGLGRHYTIE